jgi:hypothetical protein
MTKARAYVKSVKSRGSLACAFLLRAWGKRLCWLNLHDEVSTVHSHKGRSVISGEDINIHFVTTRCQRCGNTHRTVR